jgi:Domain of unknown function (DUF4338)/Transposase DNA-binding/Transposase Tn5 dimerisation domain
MVVCGREFSNKIIARIQAKVNEEPQLSRRKLSREVCEWLDWRSGSGSWQEGSCRKALVKLDRQKLLRLPDRRKVCTGRYRSAALKGKVAEVSCGLDELGEVTVVPVGSAPSSDAETARALLQRYHPLGSVKARGAQMRYLVNSSRFGCLGVVTFSSGTWSLRDRDKHIGWSEAARRRNLQHIVLNDRFLILPTVHVNNLASHVLALTMQRLPEDWEQRYKVRPLLAETFVDTSRWTGACYRAANWTAVGQSSGRRDGIRKTIYLYPLSPQWREALSAEPPAARLGETKGLESPSSWAHQEFSRVRFYDDRLKERLYKIAQDFQGCPQGSIPEACSSKARTLGAYRFFENPKVSMDVLLTSHTEAAIDRIRQHRIVLAPQDTTTLNYSTHPMTEGLGPTGAKSDHAIGLLLHDTIAVTEDGACLGVVDAQCWARDPKDRGKSVRRKRVPIAQKESQKWLRSFRKVAEIQKACPNTKLISIGDRESDVYELFQEATSDPNGPGLLVRMNRNTRRKVGGLLLWDVMSARPVDGTQPLHVPRTPKRAARDTVLDVRFAQVDLKPPNRLKKCPPIPAWAVSVREQTRPSDGQEPIEWMLLTTVAVNGFEDALQRVRWYARRWGIEVYHRTLKSGCRIQDRQLGTARGLQACLGIDMVVAWRVAQLMTLGREKPDLPCTVFFTDDEWQALCCFVSKNRVPPKQPPTLSRAMYMVGALGGHLGRKGDGPPGAETLWRGLQRHDTATEMYRITTGDPPKSGP